MDKNNALLRARDLLIEEGTSFVAIDTAGHIYRSEKRGVAPGLELVSAKADLKGGVIADKVVGKAAALLFLLLNPVAVYASTVSRPAQAVLERAGIRLDYDQLVDHIVNREGSGPCPLEHSVRHTDEPQEALSIIRRTLADLRGQADE